MMSSSHSGVDLDAINSYLDESIGFSNLAVKDEKKICITYRTVRKSTSRKSEVYRIVEDDGDPTISYDGK